MSYPMGAENQTGVLLATESFLQPLRLDFLKAPN